MESRRVQAVGRLKSRVPDLVDELISQALPQAVKIRCPKCKCDFDAPLPGRGDKTVLMDLLNRIMGKNGNIADLGSELSNAQLNDLFRRVVAGRNFKWDMDEAKKAFDAVKNPLPPGSAGLPGVEALPGTAAPLPPKPGDGTAVPPRKLPPGPAMDPRVEAENIREGLERTRPKLNGEEYVEITSW